MALGYYYSFCVVYIIQLFFQIKCIVWAESWFQWKELWRTLSRCKPVHHRSHTCVSAVEKCSNHINKWGRLEQNLGKGKPLLTKTRCYMWVEFFVCSRLAPRVILRVLRFSTLLKNQHLQISIRPGKRAYVYMKTSQGWCCFPSKYCNLLFYLYCY